MSAVTMQDADDAPELPAGLQLLDPGQIGSIEYLTSLLSRQPNTVSGFPSLRPGDCGRFILALEAAINNNVPVIRSGDPYAENRLEAAIEAFRQTDIKAYPSEFQQLQLLHARMKYEAEDSAGARALIAKLAQRPYMVEAGFHPTMNILDLDLRCRARLGDLDGIAADALWNVLMLARLDPGETRGIGIRFSPLLGFEQQGAPPRDLLERLVRRYARQITESGRIRGKPSTVKRAKLKLERAANRLAIVLRLLAFSRRRRTIGANGQKLDPNSVLVTRAMGGIGDLLMMTPGLRALSRRIKQPVTVAVPKKFFPVFANNPHIDLIDIEAPDFDPRNYATWRNFTLCPAGEYEARHTPNIRRGRVEIFARALGVKPRELDRHGWQVEINLTDEQKAFCQEFRRKAGFDTGRRLLGVQPYSRDQYKDHPQIADIIHDLATDHDVLLFHHQTDGLPTGYGIASTAGLSLEKSLALVSILDAIVSVDSAFLHAASAFEVPVVALFGPTDGSTFTRHHKQVRVLNMNEAFPCAPCWRNQDIPCRVTGATGFSPCITAISTDHVRTALTSFIYKT